jgi:uncharacterized protein with von Willebrand factor type A (vWA) domain
MAGGFTGVLTAFARDLRRAGLTAGSGDVVAWCSALALLDPADLDDVYWSGRCALVRGRDDIPVFDEVFRRFFLGLAAAGSAPPPTVPAAPGSAVLPSTERRSPSPGDAVSLGWSASDVEVLRGKSFAACSPEELAALRTIMARLRLAAPSRRTRRYERGPSGTRPDVRRVLRESMRLGGEPGPLRWQRRRVRPRPLVFLLDISGSMADYSRALLQFAYSARSALTHAEVFCFGTRLTRITPALSGRDPDAALARAAREAFDWDAGTRIGSSLESFVRSWARRGVCRGGIVVICSDGYDRGPASALASSVAALRRLCFRLVWVTPLPAGLPVGLAVARPHIDVLVPGRDLRDLTRLAAVLAELR